MKILSSAVIALFIGGPLFIGEVSAASSSEGPSSPRTAKQWCLTHPDGRESGADDEHLISVQECVKRIVLLDKDRVHDKFNERNFVIRTVTAWKLASRACNINNLKSPACMREDELDKALTSYGCTVNSATWQCPILPEKRSP